jgi:hypothetical protein
MKKSYKYLVILLVGMALVLNSCKKECPCDDPTNPDCDNYDPCFGNDTINTLFKVRPGDRGFAPPEEWCDLVACDTFNASSVRFDIPDGNPLNSSYEWQIGTEAETRKGNSFEVDFSDYLRLNGWETRIPISLTVRTPMNECLVNPEDTLVTVTRELFFTRKTDNFFQNGETSAKYQGYFKSNPNELVVVEFTQVESWKSKGIDFSTYLTIGLQGVDTFMFPSGCPAEGCSNTKHSIVRFTQTQRCETPSGIDLADLSNNLLQSELLQLNGTADKIKHIWLFDKPTGIERFEFIGEKIE